ncbi:C4-dicarboxylate transport transcriptional regulatory protein dctD [Magnetospira sp. QH-2]|nr:C4-dicarboxylate transport transcriptional regulatory protein dctD [Magnetospira sp. QH-2]
MLIDDEEEVRFSISQTLELEGFDTETFGDSEEALRILSPDWPGIVISDLKMPRLDGLGLLARAMEMDTDLPVIILTAHGDIPVAVQAIHDGAYDFMEKTSDPEQLIGIARRAMEKRRLVMENRNLRRELDAGGELERRLIGKTPVMEKLRQTVLDLADTDVDILLLGETGTGKEVAARSLHQFGHRGRRPFVALNCGALAESVIESELFGHEAGAFTGARKRRIGKIEYAEGGTLFLDEIENMPAAMQVRLLRVLQERSLERVGGNEPIAVDIRVIAASKTDLAEAAANGSFREDLMYRLQVAQIDLPPLRRRLEDLPLLFVHFVEMAAERYRRSVPNVGEAKLRDLMAKTWPGNVRELKNAAERYVLGLGEPGQAAAETFDTERLSLGDRMVAFEKQTIVNALRAHDGRIGKTAEALGLPRKTLYLRMQKYDLNRDDFIS